MTDLCVRALCAMVADKLPKYRHQYYILTTLSTYVVEGGLCVEAQYDIRKSIIGNVSVYSTT